MTDQVPNKVGEWMDLNSAIDLWLKGALPLSLSDKCCGQAGTPMTTEIAEMMCEFFNTAGREVRFSMKGVKKIDDPKLLTGPLELIPSEYFRLPRTFKPPLNEIQSHSSLQTVEQWSIARAGGERNPDWVDVIVETKTFLPWLRDFLSNFHEGQIANGEMMPDESSFILRRLGFPELHQEPIAKNFVHYVKEQVHWSLPMTIAWIASREFTEVARQTKEYFEYLGHWEDSRGPTQKRVGMIWKQAEGPSVLAISFNDLNPKDGTTKKSPTIKQARLDLERNLEGGKIVAYAVKDFASHAPVPAHEWIGLEIVEHHGRDYLMQRDTLTRVYGDVRLRADDVIALWPASPSEASAGKPKVEIEAQNRNKKPKPKSKSFKDERVVKFFEDRVPNYLPDDYPPTQDKDWAAAEKLFPDIGRKQVRRCRAIAYSNQRVGNWIHPGPNNKTVGQLTKYN